mmetsp:Transcript_3671/g.9095  ORF Transcript_3671/g.9095 Transcript_3671/m.9095 type:complete len:212 (+) Transcript_3671:611-1246(+)
MLLDPLLGGDHEPGSEQQASHHSDRVRDGQAEEGGAVGLESEALLHEVIACGYHHPCRHGVGQSQPHVLDLVHEEKREDSEAGGEGGDPAIVEDVLDGVRSADGVEAAGLGEVGDGSHEHNRRHLGEADREHVHDGLPYWGRRRRRRRRSRLLEEGPEAAAPQAKILESAEAERRRSSVKGRGEREARETSNGSQPPSLAIRHNSAGGRHL